MFSHNGKISIRQVELLLILQMFNTTVLFLPRLAAEFVGRNGYVLPIIAIVLGLVYIYCVLSLTTLFPKDTFVEFAPKIIPKFIAYIITTLFAVRILISASLELRIFSEMVSKVLLPETPLVVIMLIMLLCTAYLVKSGIEATARMAEILMYFVFVPLAIVFTVIAVRADYKQLMPFFQLNAVDLGKGAFFISLSFSPIEFMLMTTGLMKKPEKAKNAALTALIIIAILEAAIIVLTYAGIGVEETKRQIWPVLTLMQTARGTSTTVGVQEILMMAGWIFSIFVYISSGLYFTSLIGSRSMKFKRENVWVLPLVPIIYFIASIPNSLAQTYSYYMTFQRYFSLWFLVPVPLILYLIARARGLQDEKN